VSRLEMMVDKQRKRDVQKSLHDVGSESIEMALLNASAYADITVV